MFDFKDISYTTLIFLLLSSICFAEEYKKKLHKNPFVKPAYISTHSMSDNSDSGKAYSQADIELFATLYAEDQSLANVDGVIMFVGEKIKGYKLISVGVGTATFSKNGEKITLSVSELHKKLQK